MGKKARSCSVFTQEKFFVLVCLCNLFGLYVMLKNEYIPIFDRLCQGISSIKQECTAVSVPLNLIMARFVHCFMK
jgi:hypothetical protein